MNQNEALSLKGGEKILLQNNAKVFDGVVYNQVTVSEPPAGPTCMFQDQLHICYFVDLPSNVTVYTFTPCENADLLSENRKCYCDLQLLMLRGCVCNGA